MNFQPPQKIQQKTSNQPQSLHEGNLTNIKQNTEDILKKREKFAVQLRKQKREQVIDQRRRKLGYTISDYQKNNFQTLPQPSISSPLADSQLFILNECYQGLLCWREDSFQQFEIMIRHFIKTYKNQTLEFFEKQNDQLEQIYFYLSVLMDKNKKNKFEQIAIITKIRMITTEEESLNIEELLSQTQLKSVLFQILEAPFCENKTLRNQQDLISDIQFQKILKLEAGWILTNLLYGASKEQTLSIIQSPLDNSQTKELSQKHFFEILIFNLSFADFQIIDQILCIFGNLSACDFEIIKIMIEHQKILQIIQKISMTPIAMYMLNNILWICNNLTFNQERVENLKLEEIQIILNIYKTYIEKLEGDQENSSKDLADIIYSLGNLAQFSDTDQKILLIAGYKDQQQPKYFLKKMIEFLHYKQEQIYSRAQVFISLMLYQTNQEILEYLLQSEVLDVIVQISFSAQSDIINQSMFTISNFNASGPRFVQQFLEHGMALDRVFEVFKSVKYARQEAINSICNAITEVGNQNTIYQKKGQELIIMLESGLRCSNSQNDQVIDALFYILQSQSRSSDDLNIVFDQIKQVEIYSLVIGIQEQSKIEKVKQKCERFLNLYEKIQKILNQKKQQQINGQEIAVFNI